MRIVLKMFKNNKRSFVIWAFFLMALVGMMQNGGVAAPMFFNGHYYDFVQATSALPWDAANTSANNSTYDSLTGHLVTLTTKEEYDWVLSNYSGERGAWIGAYNDPDKDQGQWVTGEEWNYTNWAPGEPADEGDVGALTPQGEVALPDTTILPDLIIEYEEDPVATPEPASLALLATGLLGFAGFRRKRS